MSEVHLDLKITERADSALLRTDFFLTIGSRRALKQLFSQGLIRQHGVALKASSLLTPGKHTLHILESDPTSESNSTASIEILFEDDAFLALRKPRGVHSAPIPRQKNDTVVDRLLHTRSTPFQTLPEAGLLHRLDRWTSGVLLFAKTEAIYTCMKAEWSTRVHEKQYRARVSLSEKEFMTFQNALPLKIDLPLGHDLKDRKRMRIIKGEQDLKYIRGPALPAHTELLSLQAIDPARAWAIVRIETGVQHQIRVHLAHIGLPLDGDALYHPTPGPHAAKLGFILHHERLSFVHPITQKTLTIEDPYPCQN